MCEHIHLPLQRVEPDPQGHAPHLQPRALPRPGGDDPRARARRVAHARTSSWASRARPTRTSRRRWRWWRRCATTPPSRSSSPRGGARRRRRSTARCPHEVKRERMERLVEAVQRHATERAQRFVGRTMEVLVEGPSRTDPSKLRGRTRHNKTVHFSGLAAAGRARRRGDRVRHQHHARRRGAPSRPRGLGRRDRPSARLSPPPPRGRQARRHPPTRGRRPRAPGAARAMPDLRQRGGGGPPAGGHRVEHRPPASESSRSVSTG